MAKRVRVETPADWAAALRRDGVVVVPILSPRELSQMNADFFAETPLEFVPGAQHLVLGGSYSSFQNT